jgi:predicted  nucleic acid-binding Zn-ribbon protein
MSRAAKIIKQFEEEIPNDDKQEINNLEGEILKSEEEITKRKKEITDLQKRKTQTDDPEDKGKIDDRVLALEAEVNQFEGKIIAAKRKIQNIQQDYLERLQ